MAAWGQVRLQFMAEWLKCSNTVRSMNCTARIFCLMAGLVASRLKLSMRVGLLVQLRLGPACVGCGAGQV